MTASEDPTQDGAVEGAVRGLRRWALLDGHRAAVAGIVSAGLFLVVLTIVASVLAPLVDVQPIYYLLGSLIGGNITLITVVVSINQLVLSRELNRPGELESQIEGIVDYRSDVGAEAGQVPPAEPQGFLGFLIDNIREQAEELRSLTEADATDDVVEEMEAVVTPIVDHLDRIDSLLDESDTSTFEVLSPTISTDYAREITRLKQVQSRAGTELPPADNEAIDELVERLEEINVAQQYFKTIYLQQELASLSRQLFYVGFPALISLAGGILLLTASERAAVSHSVFVVVLPAVVTVGLLPLSVLFAYMLRVATVAERTAATAPFTTPTEEQ